MKKADFIRPSRPGTDCRTARVVSAVFGVLVALFAGLGCRRETAPVPVVTGAESKGASVRSAESDERAPLLEFIELHTAGAKATDRLPLVIGVHGLGDTPENFLELYRAMPVQCRVVLPRAFIQFHQGGSWFDISLPYSEHQASLTEDIAFAAKRVADLMAHLVKTRPTEGKPVLTGFSQGGMITFTAAVNHPEAMGLAVPVSGALPIGVEPGDRSAELPPIRAFHGSADDLVPTAFARKSVARLKGKGADATLVEYPGVPHTITDKMQTDFYAAIVEYVKEL